MSSGNVTTVDQYCYDICVIGDGPIAHRTAWQLSSLANTCLIARRATDQYSPLSEKQGWQDILWPSPNDMVTRLAVAHGWEIACYLNGLCSVQHSLPCYRLTQHAFEHGEISKSQHHYLTRHSANSNWYQESSATVAPKVPIATKSFQTSVLEITESAQAGVILLLDDGIKVTSEIVVLCCGTTIGACVPSLQNICIPIRTYSHLWQMDCTKVTPFAFRMANSQLAASVSIANDAQSHSAHQYHLQTMGPHYVSQSNADEVARYWQRNIADQIGQLGFHMGPLNAPVANRVELNYLPRDELPLVGQLGVSGRLLCATGFAHYEASVAQSVAQILAQLAMTGKSALLHSRLQPVRFFTD